MTRNSALVITLNLVAGVLLVGVLLTTPACGEKKSKKADPEAAAKKALASFADAATAHFKRNGDKFIKTGVLVFCRSGNMVHEGKLKPLGYTAPETAGSLSFCYNVHSSLKKVALNIGTEVDETRWCVVLDGTSGTVNHSKMSKKKGCLP
jgi:hypothetical protein